MNFYETSILITLAGSLAVVCIYLYLYSQYRQRYIGLWILSWGLHFFRLAFISPLPLLTPTSLLLYQAVAMVSSLLMLLATSIFVEKKLSKTWYYSAIAVTLITDGTLYFNFELALLPTCFYLGLLYCKNGLLFIRHLEMPGLGKHITGYSFIILGLHLMDMPFLITLDRAAPWGFLIDAVFRFIVAVGTIIVYFEKTRQSLIIKEQYYRLLADNASDIIHRFVFFPQKKFEYISPSIQKLTGYTPEDFYTSPQLFYELIHPDDKPLVENFWNTIPTDEFLTLRIISKDHTLHWIEQKTVRLIDSAGECYGIEAIIRDITSRKTLEQDISRLDRLNTVGEMAASVAHEIRNPMTTVRGYLQFFLNKPEFIRYKNQFELLINELDRTNGIIKEYLSLSQHRSVDLQYISLNEIIEALYPLIKADANSTNKDILLSLDEIPSLYLDGREIRQLILNLVRNGLEAMDSGGVVTIQTFYSNSEIILSIKDQGPGIPQHILDNIGKPFLTTKENGTGLGLAMCYRIANRHHAKIEITTSSIGTTFILHFNCIKNKTA